LDFLLCLLGLGKPFLKVVGSVLKELVHWPAIVADGAVKELRGGRDPTDHQRVAQSRLGGLSPTPEDYERREGKIKGGQEKKRDCVTDIIVLAGEGSEVVNHTVAIHVHINAVLAMIVSRKGHATQGLSRVELC